MLYLCLLTRVMASATSWLQFHSFSEPLSDLDMSRDWRLLQQAKADVSGLVLVQNRFQKGTVVSQHPLGTDTFRILANINFGGDELNSDDILEGQPGLVFGALTEEQTEEDFMGDSYGLTTELEFPGVYFALAGREAKFKPSVSFGFKSKGEVKTPLARGIYWNFIDKPELELMIEVTSGTEVVGHVRRKSTDAWTRAFDTTLETYQTITPNARLLISGQNTTNSTKMIIRRLQVSSTDPLQAGFTIADPHAEHIKKMQQQQADKVAGEGGDITLESLHQELMFLQETVLELSAILSDDNEILHRFYAEQRSANQQMAHLANNPEAPSSKDEVIEHIQSLSQQFQQAEKNFQGVEARISRDKVNLENSLTSFRALFESNGSSTMMNKMVTGLLVVMLIGIVFVIAHMRRLEKKHIL